MPQETGRRTNWGIPLLLCLAILLVAGLTYNLAHLDTGGEQLPATPGSGPPNPNFWGLIDPIVVTEVIVSVFFVLLIASVVYVLLRGKWPKVKRVRRPPGWMEFLPTLVAMIFFALLVYLWPRAAHGAANQVSPTGSAPNDTMNATTIPTVGGVPLGVFLGFALVLSIVVLTLVLQASASLRRMGLAGPVRSRRRAAAAAIEATITELQLGGDVRTAIMACYQRFCILLGARGIDDQEPLTPRELEGVAVTRLAVSSESAGSLTSLFEEARYSTHSLGEADRDRAMESLARIRTALGG